MIQYILRLAKRFLVLIPGLVIAYFSVRDIFPYFDRRLPIALAVLLTYILGAYLLAPAGLRLIRILRPARHLPLYCVTPDGFASDPLNIGLITNRRQLITHMESIGWHMADPHTLRHLLRFVVSTLLSVPYLNAPVSSLYLFGRKQDLAFEMPVHGDVGGRHHVRFWATTYDDTGDMSFKRIHWHRRASHVQGDNLLWVGAASLDTGISFIRHNLQITHMIAPDTNAERQLIIGQLQRAKRIGPTTSVRLGDPYRLVNRVWRGYLHTDGKMAVGKLR
ncbi:MAG: LssY C-terminal domain-containing protein [Candidatus Saccharimonadales bacterium]